MDDAHISPIELNLVKFSQISLIVRDIIFTQYIYYNL